MNPVDLRSDTVTKPTPEMRAAMATADVGDDVFGDDPNVNALQLEVAQLLGKEAALFVPSGTMSNQLALRAHGQPGDALLAHTRCHIHAWEGGGPAAISGLTTRTVDTPDGLLPPDWLLANLNLDGDPHRSPARILTLENTHNACGGIVLDQPRVRELCETARSQGVATHLDGARLMNAVSASGRSAAELAAPFDSVSLCLSKGLGAPVGSVLAGSATFVRRAWRFRKMLGGGMRQAGILAAAGRFALQHHVAGLAHDHRRAKAFAHACAGLPGLKVDVASVQTNLVYVTVNMEEMPNPQRRPDDTMTTRLAAQGVWITGDATRFRAVFHLQVDDDGLQRAIEAVRAAVYSGG
jgi:threonine aldolase